MYSVDVTCCMCPGDSDVRAMEYRQCALNMAHPGGWSRMAHPGGWSCDDVSRWLTWCVDEYGLSSDLPGRFLMNGSYLDNYFVARTERPLRPCSRCKH